MAEPCRLSGEDNIGAKGELEATTEAKTLSCRDDGSRHALEAVERVHVTLEK
jgi:hypothetical protein